MTADAWRDKIEFVRARFGALKPNAAALDTKDRDVSERILKQIWTAFVGDVFDTANFCPAVMDRVSGWNGEN